MNTKNHKHKIETSVWVALTVTTLATLPGLIFGMGHSAVEPWVGSLLFGIAIFGAAFMLSWAAEAAQVDISESLAVAILALLAVLPEYAVDFVFTWQAAHDPEQAHYAIANMTGANRLLVGLGWPVVLAIYVLAKKRKEIIMDSGQRVEVFYLAMATIYSFTIPLKGSLNLMDTVILVTLFGLYTRRVAGMESHEFEAMGPVKIIVNLSNRPRRLATIGMFGYAGLVIFFVAEPFAHSLVAMGGQFGIDKFLLVQWLAPIASEAPEFIIAATWASRGMASSALKALISSKVNQWTLLVGTIPLVFSISSGAVRVFPLDQLQEHELLLTAAQSLFALAVILNLRFNKGEGLLLFGLFAAQLVFEQIRMEVMVIYIILAVGYMVLQRKQLIPTIRIGLGLKEK